LTAANQQLKSPAEALREIMALREIIILPDKQLRLVSKPVEKGDDGDPQARRRHVRDHV
jgi:peptide deformylase